MGSFFDNVVLITADFLVRFSHNTTQDCVDPLGETDDLGST